MAAQIQQAAAGLQGLMGSSSARDVSSFCEKRKVTRSSVMLLGNHHQLHTVAGLAPTAQCGSPVQCRVQLVSEDVGQGVVA
jgi:hypothetical protein